MQVVIISSKMGSIGDGRTGGNLYGYRMSKAAANCAGATLARDLKEEEIAVGLIHPGAVSHTPLTKMIPLCCTNNRICVDSHVEASIAIRCHRIWIFQLEIVFS